MNIAARLESLASPGEILISYETYAHVVDEIACVEKGEVEVKGLAYSVATYQVLDPDDAAGMPPPPETAELAALLGRDPATLSDAEREEMAARLADALERMSPAGRKADTAE